MKRGLFIVVAGLFLLTGCSNRVDFVRRARVYQSPANGQFAADDYGFSCRVSGFSVGDEVDLYVHEGGIIGEFDDDTVVDIVIVKHKNAEVFTLDAEVICSQGWRVMATDDAGHVWSFYADGLSVGDRIVMVISDGHVIDLR